jgi:hypothetical protein
MTEPSFDEMQKILAKLKDSNQMIRYEDRQKSAKRHRKRIELLKEQRALLEWKLESPDE